jgi:hypothetical protein
MGSSEAIGTTNREASPAADRTAARAAARFDTAAKCDRNPDGISTFAASAPTSARADRRRLHRDVQHLCDKLQSKLRIGSWEAHMSHALPRSVGRMPRRWTPLTFFRNLITTWKLSRRYGQALRLKRKGELMDAISLASDALDEAVRERPSPAPPVLTTMFSAAALLDELTRESNRAELAVPGLAQIVKFWDEAGEQQPKYGTFNKDIEYFRYRLAEIEKRS